jgi:hypothetical protein
MIVIDENWSIGADKNQWVVYKTDKVGCKPTYFYPRLEQALKRVVMNDVRSAEFTSAAELESSLQERFKEVVDALQIDRADHKKAA